MCKSSHGILMIKHNRAPPESSPPMSHHLAPCFGSLLSSQLLLCCVSMYRGPVQREEVVNWEYGAGSECLQVKNQVWHCLFCMNK